MYDAVRACPGWAGIAPGRGTFKTHYGITAAFGLHLVKPGTVPLVCFAPVGATWRVDRRGPRRTQFVQVSMDVRGAARSRIQEFCSKAITHATIHKLIIINPNAA